VIIGGSHQWPAKNSLVKNASEVGGKAGDKEQVSDYRLPASSRYKNAGTDQKDVGADVDAIEAATKNVLSMPPACTSLVFLALQDVTNLYPQLAIRCRCEHARLN
jgi:hypothetical protein